VKAKMVEEDDLIYTLIEGDKKKAGKFKVWNSDIVSGRLLSQMKWKTGDWMAERGYEDFFEYDINDNGVIGS